MPTEWTELVIAAVFCTSYSIFMTEMQLMKKAKTAQTIGGSLSQVLLSPKGVIEGLLLSSRGRPVQISTLPGALDEYAPLLVAGARVSAKAIPDHSPKTKGGSHEVFTLEQLTKIGTKRFRPSDRGSAPTFLKGRVAALHYARHGEPNGVILESGDFVHLRPHGMEKSGLKVGTIVIASGERRMTVLGTTLLEAREVNHVKIA